MNETRLLMGAPICIELDDDRATPEIFDTVFSYLRTIEETYSPYRDESEISRINRGLVNKDSYSAPMRMFFAIAEETRQQTKGYFNIRTPSGGYDIAGIVKGWAINEAATMLDTLGIANFMIDAGGDIQTRGRHRDGSPWQASVVDPFNIYETERTLGLWGQALATSGTFRLGQHIYDPFENEHPIVDIVSISVIGANIFDVDRYATAAFAMGSSGIGFIEELPGFEGYMIDIDGKGIPTSGFDRYVIG